MTLREQMADDLNMFFNLDEMAAEHSIVTADVPEGMTVRCVVDNDQGQKNSLQSPGGIYDGTLLFFAKTADVQGLRPQMLLQFDGVPYAVLGIVEEDGVKQVTLAASQGGF